MRVQVATSGTPEVEPTRWANRGWLVAAAALVTWGLLAAVRIWMPSVVHVLGEAGTTPAPQLGAFALLWFLLPVPVAFLVRRVSPRRWFRIGVAILVLGRVLLQATDGGLPQLATSGISLVGGAVALIALAAGTPSGHLARVGVTIGLGLEAVQHAALATLDLAWRPGPVPWLLVMGLAATTVLVAERAGQVPLWWPAPPDADGAVSPVWTRGPAWPWLAVGPAIVLTGVLVSPPARLAIAAGLGPRAAVLVLTVAAAASLAAAALAPVLGARLSGTIGAALVVATTVGALRPVGAASAVAQLGLLVALGLVLGAPTSPADSGPRRRGVAAAASLLLLLGIGFGYYAAYDLALPFDNGLVLVGGAVLLGLSALRAAGDRRRFRPARDVPRGRLVLAVTAVLALGGLAAFATPASSGAAIGRTDDVGLVGGGGAVRVAAYNVHTGYDTSGRFDPDALADVIAASGADVVVLNEVDRGWLLGGGHDLLELLADRTGMEAVFAPAADEVWGNAILSRLPLRDVTVAALPRGGAAMARSVLSAVVDVGAGRSLGIVGTHLHHVEDEPEIRLAQARAIAAEVSRLRGRDLPVALLGDLNAPFEAPELEPLHFLEDAVPGGAPTWPSPAPSVRLDHVLITEDLVASEPAIPETTASDHRPVVVTLTPRAGPVPAPAG